MSEVIDTFRRVEDKYFITREQMNDIIAACGEHIRRDAYFRYRVHSIYYDSVNSDLVIRSIGKPHYKMKLRLRCYGIPDGDTPVFLETKKKYGDIVYKRRIQLSENEAYDYLDRGIMHHVKNNTADEIEYLKQYYDLKPAVRISYDRTCFSAVNEKDVRITFDENISYKIDPESLKEDGTEKRLEAGIAMEIKAMDRYPMWLVKILSERKLYKQSFSKYGTIYTNNFEEMSPKAVPSYVYRTENQEAAICSVQYYQAH
jgi:SPX domain protein involved in polyphosphate accumulation